MAPRKNARQAALDGRWSTTYKRERKRFRAQCVKVNAPCHLCGQAIDYTLEDGKDVDSFECDHFYPVDKYPELAEDPANFRPSHRGCNRSRGNKDVKATLGPPSEDW